MSRSFEQTNPDKPLGGRYKVIEELGAGGFGQTFLAEDLHLPGHPRCVVKQLKPKTQDPKSFRMARRLLDREAEVLYQLGNHDQIPRLLAHFEDNEEFYLAQELVDGEPLTQELAGGQPWPESQVIALLEDILQVLAFVHEQQVIHRDLKPPNLIRRHEDGKIVLIDFGAVKQVSAQSVSLDTAQTNLTISIGTQGYMPNEQLAGTPRFSSDVYAVGMLGIQALTGVHPKRLKEDIRTGEIDWREHAPHATAKLADILDQMVRYDCRDRYPTAVEALLALQSLTAAPDESAPQPSSEATKATPSHSLLVPSTSQEPTESDNEQEPTQIWVPTEAADAGTDQLSTQIWVPTELPVEKADSAESTGQTVAPPQQEPSDHLGISAPTSTTSELIQRLFVKPWLMLAVLAAVGVTFAIIKPVIPPHWAGQTADHGDAPAASPTASAASKPTATRRLSRIKPKMAELLIQAEGLREAGEYQQAMEIYDQMIALKPNKETLVKAYWGRCDSLNKLQKPAEAIVACNDALAVIPKYPKALRSKGNAFDQQKQTIEALEFYEKATRVEPDFAEAWIDRGVALQSLGRSWEALDALDKAIALNRDSAKAWSTKGEALANLGRLQEAIEALDKALQLKPDNPEAIKKLREQTQKELGR